MRYIKGKLVVLFVAVLNVSSVMSAPPKPSLLEQLGYKTNDQRALFYYIEGLKSSLIYNDSDGALDLYGAAIKEDSTMSYPDLKLAELYISQQNWEKALPHAMSGYQKDSCSTWNIIPLAQTYVGLQRYDDAQKLYMKLIELEPTNSMNYRFVAGVYELKGDLDNAVKTVEKAEKIVGRDPMLMQIKLGIMLRQGKVDEVISQTKLMINDNPNDFTNHLSLAKIYATTGKDSLASASFREALNLEPDNIELLFDLKNFFTKMNDMPNLFMVLNKLMESQTLEFQYKKNIFNELTEDMNFYRSNALNMTMLASKIKSLYPNNLEAIELYASHQIKMGELDKALELYKSYINPDSTDMQIFKTVIDIESFKNRPDSVIKYIDIALKNYPQSSELYMMKGGSMAYMKMNKEAIESYKMAAEYADADSVKSYAIGAIGDTYFSEGKMKQAFKSYDKALKLNGKNVLVLNNYAYFLSEQNKELMQARQMIEQVMEIEPRNPTYMDTYAWIQYKLGNYNAAQKTMIQAISLTPNPSAEMYLHYGDILKALGESYKATIYWEKAKEAGYDKKEIEQRLNSEN